jgi:hypothetical protein
MSSELNRRGFLGLFPAGVALTYGFPASTHASDEPGTVHSEFPSQDPALVRETVGASHTRLDRVRELVTSSPALAKASWDWGFGDWESALGAASHMGRRDIADLLIEHGARPNLFTQTMLGQLDVVKAAVAAQPGVQRIPGPHGITLLQHARNGGESAQSVVAYLTALGDADEGATSLETNDEEKQRYLGRYVFGPGDDDALDVLTNRQGNLAIKRGDRFSRVLHRVEDHGFAPGGAAAVRVRFTLEEGRAVFLTIHDPHPLVTALRQDS